MYKESSSGCSITCIQGLRWGVQPSNVERRIYMYKESSSACTITCTQGLRWGVQPSNVGRRIYKGPSYGYCQ